MKSTILVSRIARVIETEGAVGSGADFHRCEASQ